MLLQFLRNTTWFQIDSTHSLTNCSMNSVIQSVFSDFPCHVIWAQLAKKQRMGLMQFSSSKFWRSSSWQEVSPRMRLRIQYRRDRLTQRYSSTWPMGRTLEISCQLYVPNLLKITSWLESATRLTNQSVKRPRKKWLMHWESVIQRKWEKRMRSLTSCWSKKLMQQTLMNKSSLRSTSYDSLPRNAEMQSLLLQRESMRGMARTKTTF